MLTKKRMACVLKGRCLLRLPVFAGMLVFLGMMQGCAHTGEDAVLSVRVKALLEEFPAGMIDSVERADEALDAVKYENRMLDYQFGRDMDACVKRFLVNKCYDETRQQLRQDRTALRALSVEANRFKRTERVRLRDQARVDAEQEALEKASRREASRRRYEEKRSRYLQEQEEGGVDENLAKRQADEKQERYLDRKAGDEASPPRLEDGAYTTSQPAMPKNPDTALTPKERAGNVEAYREKQLESERKQESVRRRMAETQAKREKRAAEAEKEVRIKQKEAKD